MEQRRKIYVIFGIYSGKLSFCHKFNESLETEKWKSTLPDIPGAVIMHSLPRHL